MKNYCFPVAAFACALCLITATSILAFQSDIENVGFDASEVRLAETRASAPSPSRGPCDPTALCTANSFCEQTTGKLCLNPNKACTNGTVNGIYYNKSCQNTNTVTCTAVFLNGCAPIILGCEDTITGCGCSKTIPQVFVGIVSTC